eukprot:gene7803-8439_t
MVTVTLGLNKTQLALLSIYLVVAVDMFGLTLVIPVSITYSEYLGADKSMIGFLYTAYSVGALLSSLVIGRISDIFGRRKVFLYTLSGAMIWSGYAQTFLQFALCRTLAGVFTGTIGNAFAYISDVVPPNLAPIYISYVTAVISCCFVIGPIIGGGLTSFGIRVPFYCASFIAFLGLLMVYFYVHEPEEIKETILTTQSRNNTPRTKDESELYYQRGENDDDRIHLLKKSLQNSSLENDETVAFNTEVNKSSRKNCLNSTHQNNNPDISPCCHPGAIIVGGLGTFFNTFTYTALAILVPLFLMEPSYGIVPYSQEGEDLTSQQSEKISLFVGYNLGIFGLVQALCMIYLFPYLNTIIGLLTTGALGALIVGLSFLFLQISNHENQLLIIYAFLAVGNGLVRPALPAFLGSLAPKKRHGEYIAISATFSNLSMLFSGYITKIYTFYSKWDVVLLAGGCSILNAIIMILYDLYIKYKKSNSYSSSSKKQKSAKEIILEKRDNLEIFFGYGEEQNEDEFWQDILQNIQHIIHLRGYDRAMKTKKGQQLIKELILHSIPTLPEAFDDRMDMICQLYQELGHDEWAHDLSGMVMSLRHQHQV